MGLIFEYENTISTNSSPYISYNNDSEISHYSIKNLSEFDSTAQSDLGRYDDITFLNEGHNITNKAVTRIGVKNIPSIGTIAFYKDHVTGNCFIVNVIHYVAPILQIAEIDSDNKLHVVINSAENAHYDCYRIILNQGIFSAEFITYDSETYIDTPLVKGNYNVSCFGYDENNGVISPVSNTISLTVTQGLENWKPISVSESESLLNRIIAIEENIDDIEEEIGGVSNLVDDLNGEVI